MSKFACRIVWIVCACVLLFIGGCENSGLNHTSLDPVATAITVSTETNPPYESSILEQQIVVGFSQLGSESDWRKANTESIRDAAKEAGIQLMFENAEQSQEKQFEAIRGFIKQRVDVIAVSPVIESGWEPILHEARMAGIPVILSDRAVEVNDASLYITTIGSDFYEEGEKAGKYLLDKLSGEPGPIGIVELQGTEGSSPTIERGKGFRDIIKQRGDLIIRRAEPADFTIEQGRETMTSFLEEMGSDIKVLFAHNDDMALGAIEAIEAYGLVPGKDIVIISVDGTRKAFEMMVAGKINCIVECNPLLGPILMQAVKEVMDGRSLPKRIVPQESVYTEGVAEKEVLNRPY
ncbi:simple sugar transport system substrate-binding protein [Paenibacillus endophyticus]|uniref:Simple sugar transport system substrate-binding protein n=1 Tax=Paenibacillus endophyticus TaxID=1294268 RepID=A0A7W5C3A4_9BACL|nr:ABC transporter substrate-binding protein [Paenibacillus endophyticus]MBB3150438.1 simple sugar transport system substrate-binding protein [Paenibacillus endophyticus]